ncbi:MAG: 16S rRNA (guanine(527)-N(7))-methyltransferase RsmG [bacterium]
MVVGERAIPDWLTISRETLTKLDNYLTLVSKWNPAINLVSTASLADGWERHILDSAQVFQEDVENDGPWLDMGSGAGFPGLVVAILAQEKAPDLRVGLVESDRRKATFLMDAARRLDLAVDVHAVRLEALRPMKAGVVSARALAPLEKLLSQAQRHLALDGVAVFLKGQSYRDELATARTQWSFDCEVTESRSESRSVVLRIRNISHV